MHRTVKEKTFFYFPQVREHTSQGSSPVRTSYFAHMDWRSSIVGFSAQRWILQSMDLPVPLPPLQFLAPPYLPHHLPTPEHISPTMTNLRTSQRSSSGGIFRWYCFRWYLSNAGKRAPRGGICALHVPYSTQHWYIAAVNSSGLG